MVRFRAGTHALSVEWDVQQADPTALAQVCSYLSELSLSEQPHPCPVTLSCFFGGWFRETLPDPGAAARRMLQIEHYRGAEPFTFPLLRQVALDDLAGSSAVIRQGLAAYRSARNGTGGLAVLEQAGVLDRTLVFAPSGPTRSLIYRHVGHRAPMSQHFGIEVTRSLIGRFHMHDPYPVPHSRHVSAGYAEVLESGQPRLDHIRMPLPVEGGETTWRSYERLLFPVSESGGGTLLISLCHFNDQIRVPFMGATCH